MNAFKQFWIQYADFSSKTSRAHFWLAFFWNSLISLPLWVFYIVTSLSHQNAQETLNFSTVHSKTGLWALAFLAFFYFLILVPRQQIEQNRTKVQKDPRPMDSRIPQATYTNGLTGY